MSELLRRSAPTNSAILLIPLMWVCACEGDITELQSIAEERNDVAQSDATEGDVLESGAEGLLGMEVPNECGSSVDRHLANLAAASADELGRWEVTTDFELAPDGRGLQLSAEGEARCDGSCPLIRTMLSLQDPAVAAVGGVPQAFGAAFLAGWNRQKSLEAFHAAPGAHELDYVATEPGACGELFWFDARQASCSGDCTYRDPEALASKLVFAGYPDNPYLQFETATDFQGKPASMVAIDPSGYMHPGGGSCSGACDVGCFASPAPPTANTSCNCCLCNGQYSSWTVTSWSSTSYLCPVQW